MNAMTVAICSLAESTARIAALTGALTDVLPLARAWARLHPVGENLRYVTEAQRILRENVKPKGRIAVALKSSSG